jgi:MFS family permease
MDAAIMKQDFKKDAFRITALTFFLLFLNAEMLTDLCNIYNTFFPQLRGWSLVQIELPLSVAGYAYIPFAFLFGTLMINGDTRKITPIALIIMGISTIVIGRTASYPAYFASQFAMTFASRLMVLCAWQVTISWYITTRGRALGIVTMGAPFGTAVFVNILMRVINATAFAPVFTVVGIVIIFIGIASHFVMITRPEEVGLMPDGILRTEKEILKLKDASYKSKWTFKRLFSTKETWLFTVGFSCCGIVMIGFMKIFIPRMLELGVPLPLALNFMTLAAVLGIGLSYLWGVIDDRYGTPIACVFLGISFVIMSLSMFIAGFNVGNMVMIIISVICVAAATGGIPNLNPSLLSYLFGRRDLQACYRYIAIVDALIVTPFSLFFGWLKDTFGNYNYVYVFCLIFACIAIFCFSRIKITYDPERLAIKDAVKA